VTEILEDCGFHVELNQDNVSARLEGHESVGYYQEKIKDDIRSILSQG